ncbi:hypothetical protein DJ010_01360 [Nocardioides silvaticus]|uniref:Uncharacterized protein n=1 Tax=Nocardioides silvaticus TaxID=2201891 RepID=A0A316TMT0_9ACTN|nr:hypothetical protein DJ010_01360 [Nocardioides silvaticus]
MRLRRDVDALCPTPRHRDVPGSLHAARAHCREQLEEAGAAGGSDRSIIGVASLSVQQRRRGRRRHRVIHRGAVGLIVEARRPA